MNVTLAPMQPSDWSAVAAIYAEGIAGGTATFETQVPSWEKWDAGHRADCRLIARVEDQVVGWAALTPVSSRACYQGVCDVGIYLRAAVQGRGIGKQLLTRLIEESEQAALWTLQAGTFAHNTASRALHRACGFREVGYREQIAQLNGVWIDTILMERRSAVVGRK